MWLPDGPDSRYLAETVGLPLQAALADVCVMRPRDPIEFIAQCLYRYMESRERDRQVKEEAVQLQNERTDSLLAVEHLAIISHEDKVIRLEQERRKRIYLDREREVEILNSPRSSRSPWSSTGSDLGASSGGVGERMQRAATNPNELFVPGGVPPDPGAANPAHTERKGQDAGPEAGAIKVGTVRQHPDGPPGGATTTTDGQGQAPKDAGPPPGGVPGTVPGAGGDAQGPANIQPQQDTENSTSKVSETPRTDDAPPEPEVADDPAKADAEVKNNPGDLSVTAKPGDEEDEANADDPGLYTIGEQEEDLG